MFENQNDAIELGTVVNDGEAFALQLEEIKNGIFIFGNSSMGQEDFLKNIIINYNGKYIDPFLLIRYDGKINDIQEVTKDLIILRPGENFSLDIFDPMGLNPSTHTEKILEIFEMLCVLNREDKNNPIIEDIIYDSLLDFCSINNSHDWSEFIDLLDNKMVNAGLEEYRQDMRNKLRKFSTGHLNSIYRKHEYFTNEDLFQNNVLLDLSSILRMNAKGSDILLFIIIVLKLLNEFISSKDERGEVIDHLTYLQYDIGFKNETLNTFFIEELKLVFLQKHSNEMIIFETTDLNELTKDILSQCGTIACFRNDSFDQLPEDLPFTFNYDVDFSKLLLGRCVFKSNLMKYPVLLEIDEVSIIRDFSEIDKNAKNILLTKKKI
ncbi:MAG: hypothetical protein ACFFAS_06845 [Promethearchaeota archaeon]